MVISFKGKKVLVGGGSRGIGRSIALAFVESGADVAICARGTEWHAIRKWAIWMVGGVAVVVVGFLLIKNTSFMSAPFPKGCGEGLCKY